MEKQQSIENNTRYYLFITCTSFILHNLNIIQYVILCLLFSGSRSLVEPLDGATDIPDASCIVFLSPHQQLCGLLIISLFVFLCVIENKSLMKL